MNSYTDSPSPKPEYEPPEIITYSEADILEELGDSHINPVLAS